MKSRKSRNSQNKVVPQNPYNQACRIADNEEKVVIKAYSDMPGSFTKRQIEVLANTVRVSVLVHTYHLLALLKSKGITLTLDNHNCEELANLVNLVNSVNDRINENTRNN